MRRHHPIVLAFAIGALALSACGSPAGDDVGGTGDASTTPDCERVGFPCSAADVSDAVWETEGRYVEQILRRLDGGASTGEALAWVRDQPGVVAAEADATSIVFRIEGGQPSWILRPLVPEEPSALGETDVGLGPSGVVGDGTNRDDDEPDGRKRALILAPFFWQWGADEYLADVASQLRALRADKGVPDYDHDFRDADFLYDNLVTPASFGAQVAGTTDGDLSASQRDWRDYDAIFVHSHGGQYSEDTFVATGVVQEFDHGIDGEARRICDILKEPYEGSAGVGVRCGTVIVDGADGDVYYRTLGITTDLFRARYGGGLDKAVVLMGGCLTLRQDDMADALTGDDSVYLGWTDAVETGMGGRTVTALLERLIQRGEPVRTALDAVCRGVGCGGPEWDGDYGGNPKLEARGSDAAKNLRLYDLPAFRDPENPTRTTRLEDDATLRILGVPGDGENDAVELVVDVAGVIDPDDPGGGGGPAALLAPASHGPPADLYPLRFLVDDQEVGVDSLGAHRHPTASVTQLDETTFRYAFEADLPFDVPVAGRDATLKVEVGLPEDGARETSDHEVEVRLEGAMCDWNLALSGARHGGSYGGDFVALVRGTPDGGPTNLILRPNAQSTFPGVAIQLFERLPEAPATLLLGASTGEDRRDLDLDGIMLVTFADGTEYSSSHGNPCCGPDPTETLPPPSTLTLTKNDELHVTGSVSGTLFTLISDPDTSVETASAELDFRAGDGGDCTIYDPLAP